MNFESRLDKYTADFKNSEPIFVVRLSSQKDAIKLELINRYKPTSIKNDVLSEIVCENFQENFYIKNTEIGYTSDKTSIVKRAIDSIRKSMIKLIENNLPMRNPRQSKLYRWVYRNMPNTIMINDGLILIYQYIRPFCDSDMRITDVKNKPHMDNAIALLGALKEKYGEE